VKYNWARQEFKTEKKVNQQMFKKLEENNEFNDQ